MAALAASLIFSAEVVVLAAFSPFATMLSTELMAADRSALFCFLVTDDLAVIESIAEFTIAVKLDSCGCRIALNDSAGLDEVNDF